MKTNKQFIQEVANGKYNDQDIHGELQRAAKRILDEKVCSKFQTFVFHTYGPDGLECFADIYDAFTDYLAFGAEIRVPVPTSIHPAGIWQVFGMTAAESLEKLYYDACHNDALYDVAINASFKIHGEKGLFTLNTVACRHAFDKGRLTGMEAVNYCRVAA